jgi:hypothetical protein
MRWLGCLVACLFVGGGALADDAVKERPKPEDFVGKWQGKWSGFFLVQFTITQDPKSKELSVVYEWEEVAGKPLQKETCDAKLDGNTLRVGKAIEITLSPKDANKGRALGRFANPRTADLTRELPKNK